MSHGSSAARAAPKNRRAARRACRRRRGGRSAPTPTAARGGNAATRACLGRRRRRRPAPPPTAERHSTCGTMARGTFGMRMAGTRMAVTRTQCVQYVGPWKAGRPAPPVRTARGRLVRVAASPVLILRGPRGARVSSASHVRTAPLRSMATSRPRSSTPNQGVAGAAPTPFQSTGTSISAHRCIRSQSAS